MTKEKISKIALIEFKIKLVLSRHMTIHICRIFFGLMK